MAKKVPKKNTAWTGYSTSHESHVLIPKPTVAPPRFYYVAMVVQKKGAQ